MRTIRPAIAPAALIALILVTAAACAGSAALSTVGSPIDPASRNSGGQAPEPDAAAPSGAPQDPGNDVGAPVDDARIIRTGAIDLEVSDVPAALVAARDGIRAMGGYIGASRTQNVEDRPTATITYRVPGDRWEDALDLLRGLGGLTTKVVDEQTDAVEVTGAVIDLEARIRNLRASEAALQEISSRATKISDVLEVQAQLTSVRGQIEQLSAQLQDLEDRAAFATLTASFSVPVVAVEVAAKGWEPGVVVDEATASLLDILQALTTAGIWFAIVWLPLLVVVGVIVAIAAFAARRLGLGRRREREAPVAG
jgi:hypothetical protein